MALTLAVSALLLIPASAKAEFGFASGFPTIEVLDATGEPYAQAGGHPDRLDLSVVFNRSGQGLEGNPKDIAFDFPPGFSGDPTAVPTCPRRVFDGTEISDKVCPPESQVGVAAVEILAGDGSTLKPEDQKVFNVEPSPGELAVLGFNLVGKTPLTMRMRPDDFGVTIEQREMIQVIPVLSIKVTLWGVPADHQEGTSIARRPFITLPARCDRGPLTLTARAVSWQEPSQVVTATADAGVPLTGCASLPFAPAVSFDLANPAADSPSGATLALNVPQGSNPDGRASVPLEGVDVALPQGVTISPSVARGLSTCPDRELGLGSAAPATCPPSSRVGAVRLSGPQLPTPLEGNLYLGEERPGERFRVFASAEGMGVAAKFAGALRVDPSTGRITAAFEQLPEVSLSQISLRFDDGPRALLATPLDCGALTTTGTFRSYVDSRVARSSATTVVARAAAGGPCPDAPPFSPLVSGGATSGGAGQSSGLTVTLRRQSGEQLLDRFRLVLPAGLSANIGSLETCAGAAAAAAACPAASRVGSAVGEVGSGASPTALNGDAYLTGPYRRAPLGLALVFDAKVGPFDLGTIVVRAALRVDPRSGRLSVESDPLPQVLEGIPIRFLTIGLDVDRPGFIRNPTSCAPTSLTAEARAVTGAVSSSSVRFALGGCDRLRFAPRLSMRLAGRSQLRPGGSPGLRIGIRSPKRSTNLRSVDIALPKSLRRNPTGVDAICARQNALEGKCPESARVGSATGKTPILSEPLTGQTYVVQPERGGQPELWTILDAEGVRFDVRSQVFARAGRLHTKLAGLPDVPLTELVMRLDGAKGGLLSLSARACTPAGRREKADVAFEGQNDAYLIDRAPVVRSRCTDSDGARMASGRGGRRHG